MPDATAEAVVQINDVTLLDAGAASLWDANLSLGRGELALILQPRGAYLPSLVDACCGLITPDRGTIYFRGHDWRTLSADHANTLRGSIGRVFEDGGWLEHHDITENIMLSQLHHTRRSAPEIKTEATALARAFGLPGLPQSSVSGALDADLQRAACVRALLGTPHAILLEHPVQNVPGVLGPLINTLHRKRAAGSAVLWITRETDVWQLNAVRPTARYRLVGSQLVAV